MLLPFLMRSVEWHRAADLTNKLQGGMMPEQQRPKQARALETERKLLDALMRLLANKSFAELTVAELAREAGVTTGAIYRRFENKEDVLRAAVSRYVLDRTQQYRATYGPDQTDKQVLRSFFRNLLEFTHTNANLLRAAYGINDMEALSHLAQSRKETAEWLAGRMQTSKLPIEELRKRMQTTLRIATATYRDALASGAGISAQDDVSEAEAESNLKRLCSDLAEMAESYLELPDNGRSEPC